jgi:hypothetical protein
MPADSPGNPHAPTLIIGARAADLVAEAIGARSAELSAV